MTVQNIVLYFSTVQIMMVLGALLALIFLK